MRNRVALLLGFISLLALAGSAFGAPFSVGATADVFLAGQPAPLGIGLDQLGGTMPNEIGVAGGTTLTFSNVAIASDPAFLACNVVKVNQSNYQVASPDGGPCGGVTTTNVTGLSTTTSGLSGISGISGPNTMFLVGVFLTDSAPSGADPATLDFNSIGTGFASLSPEIGQTFFIGDGLTGTGSGALQTFVVPSGATRLFLGFADANDGSTWVGSNPFNGPASHYGDNFGIVNGDMNVVLSNPEPATLGLFGAGLLAFGILRRRKK